ncbi:MAG: GAF domain-containing protein [Bacteroidota bacterium]|nr:GAF domain-containing protein [Bacteroidota bacterium]
MTDITIKTGCRYSEMLVNLHALTEGPNTDLGILANTASLLYWSMENVNWAGFYLRYGDVLQLGPFHGKPACSQIEMGKGVCGTAARDRSTVVVDDVRGFPGHIACDPDSRSEIVVPLIIKGDLFGVLDVDSPLEGRFGKDERLFLESVARVMSQVLLRCTKLIRPESAAESA